MLTNRIASRLTTSTTLGKDTCWPSCCCAPDGCRTRADHEWRSPCWPLFSSTHSTACSSPSPIAHRRAAAILLLSLRTRLLPNRPKEGGSSQGVCLLSAKRHETQFWIRLRPVTEAAGAQNTGLHESLRTVAVTARDGRVGDRKRHYPHHGRTRSGVTMGEYQPHHPRPASSCAA